MNVAVALTHTHTTRQLLHSLLLAEKSFFLFATRKITLISESVNTVLLMLS